MTRPAYADMALARWRAPADRPAADEAFLHLGHWEPLAARPPREGFAAAQKRLGEVLLDLADLRDGQRVLDAGCGPGAMLAAIARRHPAARLTGVDLDERQLALARALRGAAPRADWVRADACRLPFADGSFERVLAVECAFHFSSRAAFLREAARVLAPGGLLAMTDFFAGPGSSAFARGKEWPPLEDALRSGLGPYPDPLWTEGTPAALAAAAGLKPRLRRDARAHALASLRCLLSPGGDDPPGLSKGLKALARLHALGHLRMEYHLYERA